ncbi:uncharacterized protein LOC129766078 [Toxorhynchites rutilus septentrionalis]|uniref:uncharacterized protein LOC129766078 n=1 Tax=Toxorhynchites rutilus septentrionalis TaxID=329112 RepID=UPI00247AAD77|nr:uncharacterized protein LOC129766078 [Toxorhynchites rutilus septentrionalis]
MAPITRNTSLKALQTRLKALLGMFDDICRFVDSMDDDTPATAATVRIEKLDELWDQINDTTMEIEMHEDFNDDDETYSRKRSEFGDRYYRAKSLLLEKVKEPEKKLNLSITNQHSIHEHVRLPQIKLQTFDGNIDEWLSFRDLYLSLIHCKTDLPDVEKLHYLKGCLVGEARSLIDSLAITKANYQIAWDALMKRYNDSKMLKRRQVQALFNLPSVTRESVAELQSLLEAFESIVKTLDQLVQPADYKDLLLLDVLCSRMDPTTRRSWEEHSTPKEHNTIEDLTEFLQRRIRVLSSLPEESVEANQDYSQQFKGKIPLAKTSHNALISSREQCVVGHVNLISTLLFTQSYGSNLTPACVSNYTTTRDGSESGVMKGNPVINGNARRKTLQSAADGKAPPPTPFDHATMRNRCMSPQRKHDLQ